MPDVSIRPNLTAKKTYAEPICHTHSPFTWAWNLKLPKGIDPHSSVARGFPVQQHVFAKASVLHQITRVVQIYQYWNCVAKHLMCWFNIPTVFQVG